MSTERQVQANRLNALHSTGPRTAAGKAASSQNAFKSGLDSQSQFVEGETSDDFQLLQQEYMDDYQPITARERFFVDTLIRNEWTLRRLARAEGHLWKFHTLRASHAEGVPLGAAWCAADKSFMRLQRRITLTEQSSKEAFAELDRLIAARPPVPSVPEPQPEFPEPAPQTQLIKSPNAELASFLQSPDEPATEPEPGTEPAAAPQGPSESPPGLTSYSPR